MGAMASQITSLTIVYSTVYSGAEHQSSASLAFVRGIHRSPVNSPYTRPVTRKMFSFDDVIMHFMCSSVLHIWWAMYFHRPRAGYRRLFWNRRKLFWSKGLVGLSLPCWSSTKHASDGISIKNSNFCNVHLPIKRIYIYAPSCVCLHVVLWGNTRVCIPKDMPWIPPEIIE